MKKLENFLRENLSYVKCGNERIAKRLNVSVNTVKRFKRSETFKKLNNKYRGIV